MLFMSLEKYVINACSKHKCQQLRIYKLIKIMNLAHTHLTGR